MLNKFCFQISFFLVYLYGSVQRASLVFYIDSEKDLKVVQLNLH